MIEKLQVYITCFHSMRTLHIYLPNDYYQTRKHYDVMYMFDGHNLFYDYEATYGKCWGLREYLDKHNLPLIIVGIECNHIGNKRLEEFSPYDFDDEEFGFIQGRGKQLMNWIVNDLKPRIDQKFRTKTTREHTAIAGSSMGGLMSAYTILWYNNYFSRAACLSSSFHFCMDDIYQLCGEKISKNTSVYLSWGSDERDDKEDLAHMTHENLVVTNAILAQNGRVFPNMILNGRHCEADWENEIPIFMPFLYPEFFK